MPQPACIGHLILSPLTMSVAGMRRGIVKDPFILDFLAANLVRERDLSRALTDNLSKFPRELGTGFGLVGAQLCRLPEV